MDGIQATVRGFSMSEQTSCSDFRSKYSKQFVHENIRECSKSEVSSSFKIEFGATFIFSLHSCRVLADMMNLVVLRGKGRSLGVYLSTNH